jgi:hypothetical protein
MDEKTLPTASPGGDDTLIVLGVIVVVTLGALFWALAFYSRRSPKPRRRHHHHHHHKNTRGGMQKGVSGFKELIEKNRRSRRERRSLNPTLAETGGLPPVRGEEPPPKP